MTPQQPPEQPAELQNSALTAYLNSMTLESKLMRPATLINQTRMSYAGDPLNGQLLGNSGILWEDATSMQQLTWVWYMENGKIMDDSFTAAVKANAGPDMMWNWPYTKYGSLLRGA